jgi:hypothetical protein
VLRVAGEVPQQLVGDLLDQLRLAGAERLGHRILGHCRIPPAHLPHGLNLSRILVSDRDPTQAAVRLHHVHGAPIGEAGNGELHHARERHPVVERGGQDLAGFRQEAHLLPCLLGVTPSGALRCVQASALQRLRALPGEGAEEGAVVHRKTAIVVEAELYGPEGLLVPGERQRRQRT